MCKKLTVINLILMGLASSPVLGDGGTVTFDLTSPVNGCGVSAGSLVDWSINVSVSSSDNQGLALAIVDFVQNPGNPELIDIPSAGVVPAGMADFSRPDGISNPGPGGTGTGYGGTQVGMPDQMNLAQIGGAQNNFGMAGAVMGLDVNVEPGIGQSPGGELLASGTFAAPATSGTYTFSLQSPVANTLVLVYPAPQWSPVSTATAETTFASFSFTVCRKGDVNNDGELTPDLDLTGFVDLLLDSSGASDYEACAADMNGDNNIDGLDISPFVAAILSSP